MKNIKIKLLERKIKRITSKIYKQKKVHGKSIYVHSEEIRALMMIQRSRMYKRLRELKK